MLGGGSRFRRHSGPSMPDISPDANNGIDGLSEAGNRHAQAGTSPAGDRSTLPRFPTAPISALGSRTSATSSPTSRPCRRCRAGYATTTSPFRSMSADWSAAGNSCSSIASHCLRTLRGRRKEIGAPISSTASAIAPNVTAPAIFSAALWPRNDSPVDRTRKARDGYRTSRKMACAPGRKRTSPLSLRQVNYQMAILPEVRWFASSRIFRNWATTIAQQWRSISSRCLPSMARHLRKSDRCTVIADCRRAGIRRLACRSSHAGPGQSRNRSSCGEDQ